MSCMLAVKDSSRGESPRRIALGSIDQIPLGEGRCFKLGAARIALFRPREGGVFALDAFCPHLGGPLADGLIGAGQVVCPLHAYRFRLSDGRGVDHGLAVRAYVVEVSDGLIFLCQGDATRPFQVRPGQ